MRWAGLEETRPAFSHGRAVEGRQPPSLMSARTESARAAKEGESRGSSCWHGEAIRPASLLMQPRGAQPQAGPSRSWPRPSITSAWRSRDSAERCQHERGFLDVRARKRRRYWSDEGVHQRKLGRSGSALSGSALPRPGPRTLKRREQAFWASASSAAADAKEERHPQHSMCAEGAERWRICSSTRR